MNNQTEHGHYHTAGNGLLAATAQQQGVWFHAESNSWKYWNFINVKSYRGKIDVPVLKKALDTVVRRHSSLRTRFTVRNNELFQVVSDDFHIDEVFYQAGYDCSYGEEAIQKVDKDIELLREIDFQPEQDILFRFRLIQFRDSVFMILLINHIIADNTSIQIFWNDLRACYDLYCSPSPGKEALPPGSQYLDFFTRTGSFFYSRLLMMHSRLTG